MRVYWFIGGFLFGILYPLYGATAQAEIQAHFTTDNSTPLIGEPITLTLIVEAPIDVTVAFPEIARDWPPFTVINAEEVSSSTSGNQVVYQKGLTVVLWSTGVFQTPATQISYHLTNSPEPQQIGVIPASLAVRSVLIEGDSNLRPFSQPVSLAYTSPLIVVFLIGIAGVLSFWLWRAKFKKQKRFLPASAAYLENGLSPSANLALKDLESIPKQFRQPPQIYLQAANSLRVYVRGRFNIRIDDKTTEEIVVLLEADRSLPIRRQQELRYLLERADLVKFADVQPKIASAQQFVAIAQRWVKSVEQVSRPEQNDDL